MTWKDAKEHMRQGAQLVFTNDIPGGWCFAVRLRDIPGRKRLVRVQWPRSPTETMNAVFHAYRVFGRLRQSEEGNLTWKEVREHVRQGAQLVYTNDIPGGGCLALRHKSNSSAERPRLVRLVSCPLGGGLPNLADHGPILTGLETSITEELRRENLRPPPRLPIRRIGSCRPRRRPRAAWMAVAD